MAHHRATSSISGAGAHAVSLKVLRLSRPQLAIQTPLPRTHFGHELDIPAVASLAHPSSGVDSDFPLTPLLTLPAAFGAAYVGQTFTCTLCANNELRDGDNRSVSGVRIAAELQRPNSAAPLALQLESAGEDDGAVDVTPGGTLQKTLQHELKEEGQHVLAVSVTYTETLHGEGGGDIGGRARTFRKLYQFVAQPLLTVRSKVTERKRSGGKGERQWVLEAQLENVGDASVVLEKVGLQERACIGSRRMNGEGRVVLKAQDIEQVMFLLSEKGEHMEEQKEAEEAEAAGPGRVSLAQIHVEWRSAMGERGVTTGWLTSRAR
ncbi:hypothetical protein BDY17DRAFT_327066 [Neohortaea acidophila]|uniref:Trafficking protein particle complex subunit 13 n=1 Tax=Neohortaea acidophila TaxID=245834 RepID=A0A6A6PKR0_9PEZI|nr:uncharacterized protein BDY17DRAFT_327066 [Neohortaea acidophila]KAF2480083.1 hypothetical protein BDY17DRAFT_327066 [Neohortaea acidophila]